MPGRIYKFSNGRIAEYPRNDPNKFSQQLGDISDKSLKGAGFRKSFTLGNPGPDQEIWTNGKNRFVAVVTLDGETFDLVVADGVDDYLDFVRRYLNPLLSAYSYISE